jgi:DNA ligase-1
MTKRALAEGESVQVQGNHGVYTIKKVRGVVSCSCMAWLHQSLPIDKRTCKHIMALLGNEADDARIAGSAVRAKVPVNVKENAPIDAGSGALKPTKNIRIDITDMEPSEKIDGGASIMKLPGITIAAIQFMNAETWGEDDVDPTGYWMSEKLDGVRARWIAKLKKFISRDGNEFLAPEWFKEGLPPFDLDGELWGGRGNFQKTSGTARSANAGDEAWKVIKYCVFDSPDIKEVFEVRIGVARRYFSAFPCKYALVIDHVKCTGVAHLKDTFEKVIAAGGEGIMILKSNSLYVGGRTAALLKVKPTRDAEAKVVGYHPGKGKYLGMTGSLKCITATGRDIKTGGLTDAMRKNPPPIGTVITYKYIELTDDGNPRSPRFGRVRTDVTWEDVCNRFVATTKPVVKVDPFVTKESPRMSVPPAIPVISNVPAPVVTRPPAPSPMARVPTRVEPAPRPAISPAARSGMSDGTSTDGVLYSYSFNDSLANAHKYWKVQVNGSNMTTSWGRIGTAGQSQTKSFPSTQLALKEASKKRHEKEREGYQPE